jgi:hypothetical protein
MMAASEAYQFVTADGVVGGIRAQKAEIELFIGGSAVVRKHWSVPWSKWFDSQDFASKNGENPPDRAEVVNAGLYFLRREHFGASGKLDVQRAALDWGSYHPRCWRGVYDPLTPLGAYTPFHPADIYSPTYVQSAVAVSSLFEELSGLFRYVEPAASNVTAYGHRIRELTILACTEIEAGMRGALEANLPATSRKERYTTADYVRLRDPLRLGDWRVALDDYPDIPLIAPFETWASDAPTQSIPWYESYNLVKHDREHQFQHASLGTLLAAMAALHVVQCAQWGPEVFSPFFGDRRSPFRTVSIPRWEAAQLYVPAPPGGHSAGSEAVWSAQMLFQ